MFICGGRPSSRSSRRSLRGTLYIVPTIVPPIVQPIVQWGLYCPGTHLPHCTLLPLIILEGRHSKTNFEITVQWGKCVRGQWKRRCTMGCTAGPGHPGHGGLLGGPRPTALVEPKPMAPRAHRNAHVDVGDPGEAVPDLLPPVAERLRVGHRVMWMRGGPRQVRRRTTEQCYHAQKDSWPKQPRLRRQPCAKMAPRKRWTKMAEPREPPLRATFRSATHPKARVAAEEQQEPASNTCHLRSVIRAAILRLFSGTFRKIPRTCKLHRDAKLNFSVAQLPPSPPKQ